MIQKEQAEHYVAKPINGLRNRSGFPSFAGLHHTEAARRAISDAKSGVARPDSYRIEQSKTQNFILPLALRNPKISEVVAVTGLTYKQAEGALRRFSLRPIDSIDYYSFAWMEERKGRNPENEPNVTSLAKKIFLYGLVPEATDCWDLLKEETQKSGKNWFESLSCGLNLEIYAIAKFQENHGNSKLMSEYTHFGFSVNSAWFNGQEMNYRRAVVAGILLKNKLI